MIGKSLGLIGILICIGPTAVFASASQDQQLNSGDIRIALVGKLVAYAPAGWADAGIHEEFHEGGQWKGIYYSRGPIPFSGRWAIQNNQLCVVPDRDAVVAAWFDGRRCRNVWRVGETGRLLIKHLNPSFAKSGPLPMTITDLSESQY